MPGDLGSDQEWFGSSPLAAIPYGERALPLGCYTLAYPLVESGLKSQNQLEHIFLLDMEASLPSGRRAIWIADRAYARSLLLEQSEQEQRPYIVWGRRETIITFQGRRMRLGHHQAPPQKAFRYQDVFYHAPEGSGGCDSVS